MDTIIECKNLSAAYDGFYAVEDVSFVVNQGDYVSILGDNGSGKSTLLKTLLKLKTPSKGEIVYHNIADDEIAYVAQAADYAKNFPASVFEVVLTGCLGAKRKLFYTIINRKG